MHFRCSVITAGPINVKLKACWKMDDEKARYAFWYQKISTVAAKMVTDKKGSKQLLKTILTAACGKETTCWQVGNDIINNMWEDGSKKGVEDWSKSASYSLEMLASRAHWEMKNSWDILNVLEKVRFMYHFHQIVSNLNDHLTGGDSLEYLSASVKIGLFSVKADYWVRHGWRVEAGLSTKFELVPHILPTVKTKTSLSMTCTVNDICEYQAGALVGADWTLFSVNAGLGVRYGPHKNSVSVGLLYDVDLLLFEYDGFAGYRYCPGKSGFIAHSQNEAVDYVCTSDSDHGLTRSEIYN